mgnify:CR=1 FL=1
MTNETPKGYLIIKVSTASGAIPVEGASVILQGKDENNQPIKPTIDLFTPVYRDAEDGGVVDLSNKARLKGTLTGAGVGAGMGAMSGYQGAQDDITQRYLAAKREYDDSMQKIYCVTGRHFLAQYNDMAFVAPVNEPNEQ